MDLALELLEHEVVSGGCGRRDGCRGEGRHVGAGAVGRWIGVGGEGWSGD